VKGKAAMNKSIFRPFFCLTMVLVCMFSFTQAQQSSSTLAQSWKTARSFSYVRGSEPITVKVSTDKNNNILLRYKVPSAKVRNEKKRFLRKQTMRLELGNALQSRKAGEQREG
jgi:hypothetical protein